MSLCFHPSLRLLCRSLVPVLLLPLAATALAVPLVPADPPFRVDGGGARASGALVGMDGQGAFTVVWSVVLPGTGTEIFARRYGAGGAALGPPFRVNAEAAGAGAATGLAMNAAGEMAVVWTRADAGKVYAFLRRFDAAGAPRGPEERLEPAPLAAGETFLGASAPAVGMDGAGRLVVAWMETLDFPSEVTGRRVVYRRLTAAGVPVGAVETVLVYQVILSLDLAVAPDGSFFLTTAYVLSDPASHFIDDFLFGPDGVRRPLHPGAPCLRASSEEPRVAADGSGHFLRTFFGGVGQEPTGADPCIGAFGEVFRPDGTSPQGEIRLKANGGAPRVDGAAGGGFAAVFAAGPIEGVPVPGGDPIAGSYVRVLASDGAARGGEVIFRLGVGPLDDVAYEASGAVVVGERNGGIFAQLLAPVPAACRPGPDALCLGPGDRFRAALVRVGSGTFAQSHAASALPFPDSESGGAFWFFSPDNPEMVVQLLDRASESGHFGLAYGGLTSLATDLVITDMATGAQRAYRNPESSSPASRLDPTAFPAGPAPPAPTAAQDLSAASKEIPGCTPDLGVLCLNAGRFAARVFWSDPGSGAAGQATAVSLTDTAGTFRIFLPDETAVAVKVLDGRVLNGHFWVFVAALTDIALEVEIRDTQTGLDRTYRQPAGPPMSRADTVAFR